VAIFTSNVDAENQTLIYHKCVCGALNRHFCQTRVIASGSCCLSLQTIVSIYFLCHCRVGCMLRFLFYLKRWKYFNNNFVLRWLCKLFDKALVVALAYAALAMCLQIG